MITKLYIASIIFLAFWIIYKYEDLMIQDSISEYSFGNKLPYVYTFFLIFAPLVIIYILYKSLKN